MIKINDKLLGVILGLLLLCVFILWDITPRVKNLAIENEQLKKANIELLDLLSEIKCCGDSTASLEE